MIHTINIKKTPIIIIVIISILFFSLYGIDISAFASQNIQRDSTKIVLYDSNDVVNAMDYIKTTDKDDSFIKIREYLDSNKILLEYHGNSSINVEKVSNRSVFVFPVYVVENDIMLRNSLRNILKEGKKIYLYGESITPKKYEELLDVKGTFAVPDEDVQALKENIASQPVCGVSASSSFNVIGYSINSNDIPFMGKINYLRTESEPISKVNKLSTDKVIRQIVDDQIRTIERNTIDNRVSIFGKNIPFIKKNITFADSTQVDSEMDISISYYSNDILRGTLNSDWWLYRDSDEQDPTYDRFSMDSHHETTAYNGFATVEMVITHDLPITGDNIYDWEPGDANDQSSWSISYPWGLSYSFTSGGSIDVDECGSQTNDYGRWIVTDDLMENMPNPTRFKPATAWSSIGTYAVIDCNVSALYSDIVSHSIYFTNDQNIEIRYDY